MSSLYQRLREQDRNMISDPMRWPLLRLPLKNKNQRDTSGFPMCGFMMTGPREDGSVVMYVGTIYSKLADCEQKNYTDVDALLDDGWMVD